MRFRKSRRRSRRGRSRRGGRRVILMSRGGTRL